MQHKIGSGTIVGRPNTFLRADIFRTTMFGVLDHNSENKNSIIMGDMNTGEEVSIDKQVACEECPRWLKTTEVA